MTNKPVVQHFSDILCVWAYLSHIRLEKLLEKYADQVRFDMHYVSVFPDVLGKIDAGWRDRGGFAGYGEHVQGVAKGFDHAQVHPDVWAATRPVSSTAPHLVLKAAELAEPDHDMPLVDRASYKFAWKMRCAFFRDARDIALWDVQRDCAANAGLNADQLLDILNSGAAAAALDRDAVICKKTGVIGSPTFVMNGGRQILYGNTGFHLLDANVTELLRSPAPDEASWC